MNLITGIIIFLLILYIIKFNQIDKFTFDSEFDGLKYRVASEWERYIPIENKPIKYLEIGTFYGANLISFERIYGKHPDSKLYCIDPWIDYDDYPEYKGEIENVYTKFLKNIKNANIDNKVIINRGFSNEKILTFPDNYFDIIYIDGNHEPEYVLEDAVLAFRKLKIGGYMVFDDYGWGGPDLTKKGIDAFVDGYYKRINVLNNDYNNFRLLNDNNLQLFIQKLK